MTDRLDTVVDLAERRPKLIAGAIVRQNRRWLSRFMGPSGRLRAAKRYIQARTFLAEFRRNIGWFIALLFYIGLLATLTYVFKGFAARDELVLAAVAAGVAVAHMILSFRRKRHALLFVERSNQAAEAEKAALLSRSVGRDPATPV